MNTCIKLYTSDDIRLLFNTLFERYNKNIVATLTIEEENILNEYTNHIDLVFKTTSLIFDANAFKQLVKKLYIPNNTQDGGDGDDDDNNILTIERTPSIQPFKANKTDIVMLIGLLISMLLICIAFVEFNQLFKDTSKLSIGNIGDNIKNDLQHAIQFATTASKEETTFLKFIYSYISSFSCALIDKQVQSFTNIVQVTLSQSIQNLQSQIVIQATNTCISKTQLVNTDSWGLPGQLLNLLSSTTQTILSSEATNQCILDATKIVMQQKMNDQMIAMQLLITNLKTSTMRISNLLLIGTRIGSVCSAYLIYRAKEFYFYRKQLKNNSTATVGGKKHKFTSKKTHKKHKHKKTANKCNKIRSKKCKTYKK